MKNVKSTFITSIKLTLAILTLVSKPCQNHSKITKFSFLLAILWHGVLAKAKSKNQNQKILNKKTMKMKSKSKKRRNLKKKLQKDLGKKMEVNLLKKNKRKKNLFNILFSKILIILIECHLNTMLTLKKLKIKS